MRKVWNTLVVLGILLCMVMSLGVTADAAPAQDDAAIFAVSGTQLLPENIGVMQTQNPSCLVVDVDGLDEGQSATGYNVVYVGSDPGIMTDYACIWPGTAQMFQVGSQLRLVVLVGVGEASTTDEINAAVGAYLGDAPYVIAVGPAAAAAAVSGCTDVDLFMTTGLDDTSAAGAIPVANVGKEAEAPVSMVRWNEDGTAAVSAIPVPQPVADPGVGPAELPTDEGGAVPADESGESTADIMTEPGPAELPAGDVIDENQPSIEDQPIGDVVEEVQPDAGEPEITYCTIIYDGNGRTGGMVPDVYDFIAGSTYFMAQNGYTRDGYEFAGWTIDDGETIYQPNDEVVIDHDVTIYAQWTEIPQETVGSETAEGEPIDQQPADESVPGMVTYTVTYKPGEGTGAEVAYPYNETDSKDIILPDGSAFAAPAGKQFSGWLLEGTDEVWEGNTPYTVTGDVSFVAQYKALFSVTYDFGESPTAGYTDTVFEGESYGLAGEAVVEVPANKTFGGWLVNGELKNPGDEIVVTGNVTVTAQWNEIAPEEAPVTEINVTYRSGVEGVEDMAPVKAPANSSFTLIDNPFTFPEDLVFVGWRLTIEENEPMPSEDNGNDILAPGTAVETGVADLVFTAETVKVIKATVTYLPEEGSEVQVQAQTEAFRSGEKVQYTLIAQPGEFVTPEGKIFGGWLVNGELKNPGDVIELDSDVAITAQWNDDPASMIPEPVTTVTVTYKSGVEGVADAEPVSVDVGSSFNLPSNPFTFPEDLIFTGWRQMTTVDGVDTIVTEGEPLQPGAGVNVGETDLVFVAQTVKMTTATVTYLPGDGSEMKTEEQTGSFEVGSNVQHTLAALPADFTVPEGKTFGGWKIGDSTYQPGDSVTVSENTTVTAIWNDVEKEKVDPAVDTDSLLYTKGGTDRLEVSFKAKIDTVSVDNAALTLNTQYGVVEDGDTSTVFFDNNYLNGLAEGDHTVNVTFVATDTTEFTPNTRTLTVKAEPVPTAEPTETPAPTNDVKDVKQSWDRTQNLTIDFAQYGRGNPTKLELLRAYEKDDSGNYKRDENGNYIPVWSELTNGKDYTVNGTSMTFYPSLLGSWPNQQYGFRVTFDGAGTDKGVNTMLLYLDVSGDIAKPDTTPAATGSPGYVTGDNVNLRAGAGTDSKVLRTVAKGTKITIYSISNGWASVSVDGVSGYMSADYVAYDNAAPTATPAGATSPPTGDTNNVVLYIVLLVVLIIALAAVLIVVMKRRKK